MSDPTFRGDLPSASLTSESKSRTGKQASILVVDPSPLSLLALAGILHSQGFQCVCARNTDSAFRAIELGVQDVVVWDVGDDAAEAIAGLKQLRELPEHAPIPAILLAEARWAGLEKKTEAMSVATCCLFKPIDPNSLSGIVDGLLWMPQLETVHRRRGSRPSRAGWITL